MRPLPPELLAQLASPQSVIAAAWAEGLRPDPERTVDQWADACRVVPAESGTPWPGPWSSDRVPYLREVMRCLSLSHPAKRVTFKGSYNQTGQTGGVHLLGTCRMGNDPASSVVDRYNRSHEVPNLFMVDGSSLVTSGRGQPTMTIMALAFRAAEHMVAAAQRGDI